MQGTPLYAYLGCEYESDGNGYGNVSAVNGTVGSEWSDYQLQYSHYSKADYSLDIVAAGNATLILHDQDHNGRVALYEASSGYRIISSTLIFGALKDGDGSNTKANLLHRYLTHLLPSSDVPEESVPTVPQTFTVYQNYPNPFNAATILKFSLATAAHVSVEMYDNLGRPVSNVLDDYLPSGTHQVTISSHDLASGRYLCRVSSGSEAQTVIMTVLK